jgi:hypothetical protein
LLLQLQILQYIYIYILHTQNKFSIDLQNPTQKQTNKQTTNQKPSLKTQKQKLKQMTKVEAVIFFLGGGREKKKPELQLGNAMQCSQSSKVVFVETRRSKKRQLKEMMN